MSTAEDDLRVFTAFVQDWISKGDANDLSLAELFELWMLQNPIDSTYANDVAAINASINDFISGKRGTLAGEHSRELRQKYGLTNE